MRGVLSVKISKSVDVGRADERPKDLSGRSVDWEKSWHELVADDGVGVVLNGEALDVKVAAGKDAQRLEVVPRGIRCRIRYLDIGTIFPLNMAVGVVEQLDALGHGLRVGPES